MTFVAPRGLSDTSARPAAIDRDDELQRLRNRIAELENALGLSEVTPLLTTALSPNAARLLALLLKRGFVPYEAARLVISPHAESLQLISVYICKLRGFLGPDLRGTIKTLRGRGVYIKVADKAKVRAYIARGGK